MNENKDKYKKRLEFQQKMISRQSEEINGLKSEIEELKNKLEEKDEIIRTVEPMRKEMTENIKEQKRLKEQYKVLILELKKMRNIVDEEVYKGKWKLIKFFLK